MSRVSHADILCTTIHLQHEFEMDWEQLISIQNSFLPMICYEKGEPDFRF